MRSGKVGRFYPCTLDALGVLLNPAHGTMEPWKIGGHFGRDLKRTKEEMMEGKKRGMRKRYYVCGSEETFSSRPKGRCRAIP
jgi:hypothetical protein